MIKVITYGTYDLLHYGHIKLLERAKALGDYLIVGITSDDFDKARGKINVRQSLIERIDAVKKTGLADEIIVEEYEGQKIDDIKKYGINIFTVGSDWVGKFDYLNEFCQVIYLPRTDGISSSEIRANSVVSIGIIGTNSVIEKFYRESTFVNGVKVITKERDESLQDYLKKVDAIYIANHPKDHFEIINIAIDYGKHVLCESPITISNEHYDQLRKKATEKGVVLMDGIKTAFSTAYNRLILLAKSGKIGQILSVDATCTSMDQLLSGQMDYEKSWNSICAWGPTALLPVFQILGTNYVSKKIISKCAKDNTDFDEFTKIDFIYKNAVASIKVAKAAKSEGELIITGTKGYIYVPAPWWKTDYFEIRFENPANNIRQFYQLEGEGIRYEIISFVKAIDFKRTPYELSENVSESICEIIDDFYKKEYINI